MTLKNGKKLKWLWESIAFAFSFWAIVGSGEEIVFWGFLVLMAGIPFTYDSKKRRKKARLFLFRIYPSLKGRPFFQN